VNDVLDFFHIFTRFMDWTSSQPLRVIDYLNSQNGYIRVQNIGLWLGALFFTILFLYMVYLRPGIHTLDFGWTWIIGSIALLFVATLIFQRPSLQFRYVLFIASLAWINCICSVIFTIIHFILPLHIHIPFGNKDYSR
jgi:hypothetical protein